MNGSRTRRWRGLVAGLALMVGCAMPEVDDIVVNGGGESNPSAPSSEMSLSYLSYNTPAPEFARGRLSTRSLVDKETTVSMSANFLRANEDKKWDPSNPDEHQRGLYTFDDGDPTYSGSVNWETAYLLEATLMSSPDNSPQRLRSVFLDPVQSYDIRVRSSIDSEGNKVRDTTDFYHTRMVSWYPLNCQLKRSDTGVAATSKFGEMFPQTAIPTERDVDGDGQNETVMAVQFTDLDGSKDLMVSDMREGQYWHFDDRVHRSDFVPDGHPYLTPGEHIYHSPFGHFYQEEIDGVQRGIDYLNYFTYKHYLSAVRIYAYADDSPQSLLMWGKIENVIIANQPTSVKVWLPDKEGVWGEAFDWADHDNFPIATDPIFGDGDTNSELNESVSYPISMEGSSATNEIYLGYALIQPDNKLSFQLHTSSGVYVVDISNNYEHKDEHGNEVTTEVFKAGYIYDIHLNLKTSGSIAALLEKEADDVYYDLTRLHTYENPGEGDDIAVYKYANCYICSPMHTYVTDHDGNYVLDGEGNHTYYDGFCFSATTIGNGEGGIFSSGAQTMYPTSANIEPKSARLLWESSLGLVTQVELLFGYVRFKVPDRTKEGNAVIAVYDEEGNVLWSWHIWITDPPREQTFENGDNDIVILDRNLGATSDKWVTGDPSTALETYGLYYQWGRKDPSMSPLTYDYIPINLMTQPYYDYSSRERVAAEVVQFARPTLRDGVENPMFLILPTEQTQTYYYNWTYELYDFLWGYNHEDGTIDKTIYDPCPFGYRVPLSEISTIISNNDETIFQEPTESDYGQILTKGGETFYFPYAGYKGVDVGLQSLVLSWRYVGQKGDYMSAAVNRTTGSRQYHRSRNYISRTKPWTETNVGTYNSYRTSDYTNRRTAASVRCVKNEPIGVLYISLTPSKWSVATNDEVALQMEGSSNESHIVSAQLTVTNLSNGVKKVLYTTPEGDVESTNPKWTRTVTFNTGDEEGEFYSPKGYSFQLTCKNDLGVSKTVTEVISYHTMFIDLNEWEQAEATSHSQVNNDIVRNVHIKSDVAPLKVEVEYRDHNDVLQVVDISATQHPTQTPSEGYASSLYYVAEFNFPEAGVYNVSVRATCGGSEAHERVVTTTVAVYDDLSVELDVEPRYMLYSAPESVDVSYTASSDMGIVKRATLYLDLVPYVDGSVYDNESATLAKNHTIADIISADTDGNHRVEVAVTVVDDSGTSVRKAEYVSLIGFEFEPKWSDEAPMGQNFVRTLRVVGGAEPTSLTVGGVAFSKVSSTDASNYYSDTTWEGVFNYPAEGTYDDLWVEATFEDGTKLSSEAPEINITRPNEPLSVSISLSRSEIFFGDKTESATINASASSPNGKLTNVTIVASDGQEIYSGNPAAADWSNNALAYTPTSGGLNRTFTITAEDEFGVTATATTTAANVYRVTKKTVAPGNLTNGGTFIIENATSEDYLYANGESVEPNSTLSSDVFVITTGYTQRQIRFSNGNYLYMNATSWSCAVSASTESQSVTLAYTNQGYTITKSSGRTYYLYQNNDSIAAAQNNPSRRYWNIYEVTTD